jgi:hypothetical protein
LYRSLQERSCSSRSIDFGYKKALRLTSTTGSNKRPLISSSGDPRLRTEELGENFSSAKHNGFGCPEIVSSLEQLPGRDRNLVLVGHGIAGDQTLLKVLGFNLETSVVGVLDTEYLAQYLFGGPRLRLRSLLIELKCPFDNLHCAGNDAHFALRALLLLAVQGYLGFDVDDVARDRLEMLHAIGQAPLPHPCLSTPIPAALAEEDKEDAIDGRTWAEK